MNLTPMDAFAISIVLFVMYIVHLCLYDRCCRTMFFLATNPSRASVTVSRALDPAVLKSLPVFTFSDVTHKDPIECPVCLSEFEDGESGRVLPGCRHAFHVECIDMWFHSHSTCPLCRSLVVPLARSVTMAEERVTIITISPEPASATEPDSTSGTDELDASSSCQGVMTEESDIELGRRSD